MKQINEFIPHKNILIQYNKGYKCCKKELYKQISLYDLNDAYYHAFLHSLKNNESILTLELNHNMITKMSSETIAEFFILNKTIENIYMLKNKKIPDFLTLDTL
jgi:hypothetical protein